MASRKQKAAARRNIKKARAALKRKFKKKSNRRSNIKKSTQSRFTLFPVIKKKHRRKLHYRRSKRTTHVQSLGELAVVGSAAAILAGLFLNGQVPQSTPAPSPSPSPQPTPSPSPPPQAGALILTAAYSGIVQQGQDVNLSFPTGVNINDQVFIYVTDTDPSNNSTWQFTKNSNPFFVDLYFTPDSYSHTQTIYAINKTQGTRSNTTTVILPAVTGITSPVYTPPSSTNPIVPILMVSRGAIMGGNSPYYAYNLLINASNLPPNSLVQITAVNQNNYTASQTFTTDSTGSLKNTIFSPTGWTVGDTVTVSIAGTGTTAMITI